jgi:hypothetical protein
MRGNSADRSIIFSTFFRHPDGATTPIRSGAGPLSQFCSGGGSGGPGGSRQGPGHCLLQPMGREAGRPGRGPRQGVGKEDVRFPAGIY